MKSINNGLLGFSCAVLLAIGAFAPLPAQAVHVYNVKTYHATGNGVTDDTFYIQQANYAAAMDPGSILLFPKGNYVFSGELLNINSHDMVGENATLILQYGPVRLNGSNDKVYGMNFVTRDSPRPNGMLVTNVNGFEIRDCTFGSGFDNVISVTQSSNGKIAANQMAMSTTSSSGISLAQNSGSISVENNVITGSGGSNATAFQSSNSSNLSFTSNSIRDVPFGATSRNDLSVSYTGNTLASCTKQGIGLSTDRKISISNNKILSTGGAAVLLTYVDSVEIQNNVVQGCQTGVNLQGTSGSVDITGNTISAADIYAVSGGNASVLYVEGNKFSGVANAVNISNISVHLSVQNNDVADTFYGAFSVSNCTASSQIQNNTIRNCGRYVFPGAVIYFNSAGAAGIAIKDNTYSGSTTNLKYFIWCVQSSADISGNRTNTGLPNRIGS